ncbi:MAG: hypothetical protein L6R39_003762 [Caloplaca ligustica]|nr:MAG: hypothetical protein L6R39_003762 [Caloplaca ligustica]
MAPTSTVRNKLAAKKTEKGKGLMKATGPSNGIKKTKPSKGSKIPPPKQQKTKPSSGPPKKRRKVYTEKELGLPKLNMITPVGVDRPKGKKKGKVFVDDQESMMTILAIVNANKEGQIESKMMKSRQLEEIREARRKEAEARQQLRSSKLEETKDALRQKKRRKAKPNQPMEPSKIRDGTVKKSVSFA